MSPARATMLRAQPFQPSAQPGCTHEAVRARKTRPCGGAPLMCAAAARARPDRVGLSDQAGADRRTPLGGWGEPEPGRRSLQQRGEPARSGMPRPDGLNMSHTISGRAVFFGRTPRLSRRRSCDSTLTRLGENPGVPRPFGPLTNFQRACYQTSPADRRHLSPT